MPAAVLVGIDSSDTFHQVEAAVTTGDRVLRLQVRNDLSGFQQLEAALTAAFGDLPRRYALENPASLLGRYLLHREQAVYAVNPRSVARLREGLHASGKKDDPVDAHACGVVLRERECQPIRRSSPAGALVTGLVQQRIDVVEEKNRVMNQLTAVLKGFYPRALELFADLDQPLTLDFLTTFRTPTALQQASLASWQALFDGKRYPHPARIGTTLWERAQAPQVPVSPTEETLGSIEVGRLVRLLRVLLDELQHLNQQIETDFAALPAARVFDSVPGAGPVLGPALFAIFGDNPDTWPDWRAVAQACGSVPVTRRSGGSCTVNQREHCDKRARRILHLFAGCSRRGCAWAREFYTEQRRQGKKHATA
jgi:transposase